MIPGLGRSPGEGHGNPLQYSCLENPHGWRSLVGYSPWGGKESDSLKLVLWPECIFLGELEKNLYSDVGMHQSIDVHLHPVDCWCC